MSLELNALWRKYMEQTADLDSAEAGLNASHNDNANNLRETRTRDLKSLAASMASKGMAHSGVALEGNTALNKSYDEGQARADQERNRLISDLARKRLAAKQDYEAGRAGDSFNLLAGVI